jgi:hypothetical protein
MSKSTNSETLAKDKLSDKFNSFFKTNAKKVTGLTEFLPSKTRAVNRAIKRVMASNADQLTLFFNKLNVISLKDRRDEEFNTTTVVVPSGQKITEIDTSKDFLTDTKEFYDYVNRPDIKQFIVSNKEDIIKYISDNIPRDIKKTSKHEDILKSNRYLQLLKIVNKSKGIVKLDDNNALEIACKEDGRVKKAECGNYVKDTHVRKFDTVNGADNNDLLVQCNAADLETDETEVRKLRADIKILKLINGEKDVQSTEPNFHNEIVEFLTGFDEKEKLLFGLMKGYNADKSKLSEYINNVYQRLSLIVYSILTLNVDDFGINSGNRETITVNSKLKKINEKYKASVSVEFENIFTDDEKKLAKVLAVKIVKGMTNDGLDGDSYGPTNDFVNYITTVFKGEFGNSKESYFTNFDMGNTFEELEKFPEDALAELNRKIQYAIVILANIESCLEYTSTSEARKTQIEDLVKDYLTEYNKLIDEINSNSTHDNKISFKKLPSTSNESIVKFLNKTEMGNPLSKFKTVNNNAKENEKKFNEIYSNYKVLGTETSLSFLNQQKKEYLQQLIIRAIECANLNNASITRILNLLSQNSTTNPVPETDFFNDSKIPVNISTEENDVIGGGKRRTLKKHRKLPKSSKRRRPIHRKSNRMQKKRSMKKYLS